MGALLEAPLAAVGFPSRGGQSVSLVVAMVLATLLSMLLGELVPKNMAIALSLPHRQGAGPARSWSSPPSSSRPSWS